MANINSWQESIKRYDGEETAPISFSPSVRYSHDVTFCKVLFDDLRAVSSNWEKRVATPRLWTQLPDASGLYMFVWRPEHINFNTDINVFENFMWCLYIGQAGANYSSNTIKGRYQSEYSAYLEDSPDKFWENSQGASRKNRLRMLFSMTPLYFWYTTIEDREKIETLEKRLIKIFRPPGNISGTATLKMKKPIEAFRRY